MESHVQLKEKENIENLLHVVEEKQTRIKVKVEKMDAPITY
jgi:hypothetical protein